MEAEEDHFWWLLAVFIIALLIIILICLMKRKRIFRCFQRLIFQRDSDDSENRLYHLVSEGYEDVNVCVFLTQAAAQLSSEIQTDSGFEFNLPSDSLNQTLNPDCEQSWYLQSHFSREIMFRVRNQTAVTPNSEIQTDSGFEFNLPSDSLNQTLNPDCEQSWYLQSHFSREIMFRVRNQTAVTPNSDDLNEASLQHSDLLWWFLAVSLIVLLVLMCFFLRKRIFRQCLLSVSVRIQKTVQLNLIDVI
ncbi:hypothetical protein ROHU_000963 [Labeo rohita]|uniref:Uncharacterized protein n=1 Tax=Labeo rohita TaxID=84645 RepID=A0A498P1X3_LABRO|nr:hypothetical protein ROHU_000963 [Labeo rohita]